MLEIEEEDEKETTEDQDARGMCNAQLGFNEVLIFSRISQEPATSDIITEEG